MPLPARMQDATVKAALALAVVAWAAAVTPAARQASSPPPPGAAFFVRGLGGNGERRESRPDILDTPVLPGSVIKVGDARRGAREPGDRARYRASVPPHGDRRGTPLRLLASGSETPAHAGRSAGVFLQRLLRVARHAVAARDAQRRSPTGGAAADSGRRELRRGARRSRWSARHARVRCSTSSRAWPASIAIARWRWPSRRAASCATGWPAPHAMGPPPPSARADSPRWRRRAPRRCPADRSSGLPWRSSPPTAPTRGVVVVTPGAAGLDAASIAADLLRAAPRGAAAGTVPADISAGTVPAEACGSPPSAPADDTRVRIGMSAAGSSPKVVEMDLEDYVARVLAGEGQPRAGAAAQQALAITVRTFAVANRGRHRREGFDFCDTTHCQVFRTATDVYAPRRGGDLRTSAAARWSAGDRLLLGALRREVGAGVGRSGPGPSTT